MSTLAKETIQPDEVIHFDYSHDYPNDTHLTYTRTGKEAHLEIAFQSEDPDMGTEEMIVNGDSGESFIELVGDARAELTDYLDRQDTSSFYQQQGDSPKDGIHDLDDYYGEFSRTSLYAFENAMKEAELQFSAPVKTSPELPSAIRMKSYSGYRKNVFEGWKKLDEATITGEGYKVEFFRLSEKTIDRNCDALNGWYNIWTKFRCEYTDAKGTLSITVRKPEEADRISAMLSGIEPVAFEHEDMLTAADTARIKLESLISFMKAEEKPSIQNELKRSAQKSTPGKGKSIEMEI